MRRIFFLAAVLLTNASFAAPVTWTLNNIILSDGGSLTGSFVFDADTTAMHNDPYREEDVPAYYSDFELNLNGFVMNNDNAYVEYNLYHDNYNPMYPISGIWLGGGSDATHLEIICDLCVGSPGPAVHIYLFFDAPLTSSTDPANIIDPYGTDSVWDYLYSGVGGSLSGPEILSGSVVASVVPIPAAAWLFGSALAGLGWLRRKETA